jgi:UDP-perosamine 4-acetyltransferase
LDCLQVCGVPVQGIIDAALPRGALVDGVTVLGGDEQLAQLDARTAALCIGVGMMPGGTRRAELFSACRERGFELLSVMHPSATLAPRRSFGAGVQVMAGAVVQTGVRLEDNVIVNTRASVDHDCSVGGDVMIGPGAVLCGEVHIGAGTYVGAGAVILPGVRIGARAVIGAGSIVTRDVAEGAKVGGNPARVIGAAGGSDA